MNRGQVDTRHAFHSGLYKLYITGTILTVHGTPHQWKIGLSGQAHRGHMAVWKRGLQQALAPEGTPSEVKTAMEAALVAAMDTTGSSQDASPCAVLCLGARVTLMSSNSNTHTLCAIAPPATSAALSVFCRHVAAWVSRATGPGGPSTLAVRQRMSGAASSPLTIQALALPATDAVLVALLSVLPEGDTCDDGAAWCTAAVRLLAGLFGRVGILAGLRSDWTALAAAVGAETATAAAARHITEQDVIRVARDIAAASTPSSESALAMFRRNPFSLYHDRPASFEHLMTADAFARMYGVTDAVRISEMVAAKLAALMTNGGHSCFPLAALARAAAADPWLASGGWDQGSVQAAVLHTAGAGAGAGRLVVVPARVQNGGDAMVYLACAHATEASVAAHVIRLSRMGSTVTCTDAHACACALDTYVLCLSSAQRGAAMAVLASSGLIVLTGPAGTGKSRVVAAVRAAGLALGLTVLALAPTGKAASRLGGGAMTLHRALGTGTHARELVDFLDADLVIVDDASMLDAITAAALLGALDPRRTRLMLVGDAHQLPSVGWGDVLAQLLAAPLDVVRRHELTELVAPDPEPDACGCRTGVLALASAVARGGPLRRRHLPEFVTCDVADGVAWVRLPCAATPVATCALVRQLHAFHGDDLSVLTPSRRHGAHVCMLNDAIRSSMPTACRVGDRVVVTRNRYDADAGARIFNGECGTVVRVAGDRVELCLPALDSSSEGTRVAWAYPHEFDYCYAMTVHKALGSKFPVVAVVLSPEQGRALNRALLYTAITRAQRRVYIVADKATLALAVSSAPPVRFSGLADAIVASARGAKAPH